MVDVRRVRRWELALVTALVAALYLPKLGSYNLWDPWETHYGEVARRMMEDEDWIRMRWQDENFWSKPVLTFWLMAAGMKAAGVADGGGYSGEFVSSHRAEWGVRVPFALFGVGGVVLLWYMLARLYSRRAAWLSALVLATSPYYFFISRQAITDMPSCALLVGSMALFLLAIHDGARPPGRWGPLGSLHGFLAAFAIIVLGQLIYFSTKLTRAHLVLWRGAELWGPQVMIPFFLMFVAVVVWAAWTTRTAGQVAMYWFYLFNGVAVLAKGPVAPALAGLTILCYLAATGEWRLLRLVEIPRGLVIGAAVCLPWHFAIYLLDGKGWLKEYIKQHLFGRAFVGVHGDRGTFDYFLGQLGVGMWPWVAFLPVAIGAVIFARRARTREEQVRTFVTLWGVVAFAFFCIIQTKFHHYLLPAIPAFAMLVAFWFDDLLAGRVRAPRPALLVALGCFVVTTLDVALRQQNLVHLFVYRYDRPWPSDAPWRVDFTPELLIFAGAFGLGALGLLVPRARRAALGLVGAVALGFTVFAIDGLMIAASPHWGQRELHEHYYKNRTIHGVDIHYEGLGEFLADWDGAGDLEVRTFLPDTLEVGAPMRVGYDAPSGKARAKGELLGHVASLGDDRFTIEISPQERAELAPLLEAARAGAHPPRRRTLLVDADRLIAWKLNWRGENLYSSGEIWSQRFEDARTVWVNNDKGFTEYLRAPARTGKGRKFWLITEKGRLTAARNLIPTPKGKETFQEENNSSNKYGMASFVLD